MGGAVPSLQPASRAKTDAQDGSNVPVIRVEAHQVLIPVFVTIKFDLA